MTYVAHLVFNTQPTNQLKCQDPVLHVLNIHVGVVGTLPVYKLQKVNGEDDGNNNF